MARKKSSSRSTHDRRVQREAKKLKDDGWNVNAAGIRGYPEPGEVAGRRPDIIATKRGRTKIIEVEMPETEAAHREQASTLRRHAAQKPNTDFQVIVTRPRKKK